MKNSIVAKTVSAAKSVAKAPKIKPAGAEAFLWRHLRAKRFEMLNFKRQQPIGRYVVGFVSLERKLIIEIDGGPRQAHSTAAGERDHWLREQGFVVLRVWNHSVVRNVTSGLDVIDRYLTEPPERYH